MLARGAERAERPLAVSPDQPVRRLRHGVAADDPQAEPLLERLLPLTSRGGAGVAEPQVGLGVVGSDRLAHQDLQHRPDGVELGRAVASGRVQEPTGREAWQQDQAGTHRERAEHGVGRRVDVEQRQRGHQPVLGRQLHPVREADPCHRVGAVRLHDQLGLSGGARGGDEHGEVVGADGPLQRDVGDGALAAPVAEQFVDVEHLEGERCGRLEDMGPQGRVGDNHPGAAPGGRSPASSSRVPAGSVGTVTAPSEASANQHRTYGGVVRAVTTTRSPRPTPVSRSRSAEPGHVRGSAAEGQRALVGAQPGRAGVSVDGGGQQAGNGLDHGPRHRHRPSLSDRRVRGNARCSPGEWGRHPAAGPRDMEYGRFGESGRADRRGETQRWLFSSMQSRLRGYALQEAVLRPARAPCQRRHQNGRPLADGDAESTCRRRTIGPCWR